MGLAGMANGGCGMIGIIGIVVIFVMVFGGYMAAGGKLGIILHSLPFEMAIIMGAAVGAFLIANDKAGIGSTVRDLGKVFRGPKWKPADYRDLLCLLFELIRIARANPVALEEHIEAPGESEIFGRYPRIQADHEAVELISDTLRSGSMNYDDPHQVEEVLEKRIETAFHHTLQSSHALQTVADGLPALGIVAAVLGVIKTMASIDQPPEILGGMIGGALVGTFLGVFLAYGLVGPFAARLNAVALEDGHFLQLIREVLVANLYNHTANICIEVGRQNAPHHLRPNFADLEDALKAIKQREAA
ncbi:chemotaxis protein MotA [Rhodobacteraceae bacterium MBR-64]